jgi:hypothetical protein
MCCRMLCSGAVETGHDCALCESVTHIRALDKESKLLKPVEQIWLSAVDRRANVNG